MSEIRYCALECAINFLNVNRAPGVSTPSGAIAIALQFEKYLQGPEPIGSIGDSDVPNLIHYDPDKKDFAFR